MATGTQFMDALREAIAPATVTKMHGLSTHLVITLSDGRRIEVTRHRVKQVDAEQIGSFVSELLGG